MCRDEKLFVGDVDEEYICSIGQGVLVDPVMAPCQHEFCESCILECLKHKKECPLCRRHLAPEDMQKAYKTTRMVSKLEIWCDNRPHGCTWSGKWVDLIEHQDACDYESVKCPYDGCTAPNMYRKQMTHHLQTCPYKSFECQYCRKMIPGCNLKDHEVDCPKRPVKCTQHCQAQVTMDTLSTHIKSHCPLTVVPCPFSVHGCDVDKLQRMELDVHMRDATAKHLELLCKKVEAQDLQIKTQQSQIRKLYQRSQIIVDQLGKGTFTTVSDAVAAAEDGDRIIINAGLYRESIVINKNISLQAAAEGQVRIENGSESNVIVIRNTCKLVGLHLHQRSKNFFCIRIIVNDDATVIEKCDIVSDHFSCIQIDCGCNPLLRNNKIHDSKQCGILIKKNGKGRIENNDIHSNSLSNIYVDANANPVVTSNKIHNSAQHGIWIKQYGIGVFENNTIYNNTMSNIKIEEGAAPIIKNNYI
uniref:RING-type E3 ubiquitin transferase n=1 Tax=Eutreptiella gymnastica TaxID=73025 RepID=A0A7S1J1M0_9EUGL|mmetsp:Transcript_60154/g.107354  ORF Transcript_60154/g.107354 Transcript_60154/m.107354 type:complete len:472 (+) Transcript_60154:38-1453(+)